MSIINGYTNAQQAVEGYTTLTPAQTSTLKSGTRTKICFAISELFGQGPAQGFGYFAEAFIMFKLLPQFYKNGIAPLDMYTDYAFAGSMDKAMIGFLMQKNPTKASFINSTFSASPHKRPDILVHTAGLQEFYEIKPDSVSGRLAGKTKIATIDAYMLSYGLPYRHGTTFVPPANLDVGHFYMPVPGKPPTRVDISIDLRISQGGIYYKICIEADWAMILSLALVPVLIAAVFKFFKDIFASIGEIIKGIGDWIYEHPVETAFIAFAAIVIIIALLEPTPIGEGVAALILAAEAEVYAIIAGSMGLVPVLQPALQYAR